MEQSKLQIALDWWNGLSLLSKGAHSSYYVKKQSVTENDIIEIYLSEHPELSTLSDNKIDAVDNTGKEIEFSSTELENFKASWKVLAQDYLQLKEENERLNKTIDGLLETGTSALSNRMYSQLEQENKRLEKENERLQAVNAELLEFIKEMANRYSQSEWIAGEANKLISKNNQQ